MVPYLLAGIKFPLVFLRPVLSPVANVKCSHSISRSRVVPVTSQKPLRVRNVFKVLSISHGMSAQSLGPEMSKEEALPHFRFSNLWTPVTPGYFLFSTCFAPPSGHFNITSLYVRHKNTRIRECIQWKYICWRGQNICRKGKNWSNRGNESDENENVGKPRVLRRTQRYFLTVPASTVLGSNGPETLWYFTSTKINQLLSVP